MEPLLIDRLYDCMILSRVRPAAELPYLSFGHAPPYAMWILTLLHFVLLTRAIHNYTIDDASPLITYNAPVLERNITAFDSHLLWDGTVTYIAPAPVSSPTISIPFNGASLRLPPILALLLTPASL